MKATSTYIQLHEGGAATTVPVDEQFWAKIDQRPELHAGRLVMEFAFTEDWATWEIHPSGDEVVMVLEGEMELFLEGDQDGIPLAAGDYFIVPKGRWHTANVATHARALFITPGQGTENKPRQ